MRSSGHSARNFPIVEHSFGSCVMLPVMDWLDQPTPTLAVPPGAPTQPPTIPDTLHGRHGPTGIQATRPAPRGGVRMWVWDGGWQQGRITHAALDAGGHWWVCGTWAGRYGWVPAAATQAVKDGPEPEG